MARVLLIEDSPLQSWTLSRQLQALGHAPLVASSCAEALARWQPGDVDAALVALQLVKDNGFQCGSELRDAGFPNILLLADVPRETDTWWARGLGLGCVGGSWAVLQRPLTLQALATALSQCIEESGHGQSP